MRFLFLHNPLLFNTYAVFIEIYAIILIPGIPIRMRHKNLDKTRHKSAINYLIRERTHRNDG